MKSISMEPVEGAMVRFCSDEACKMAMTDGNGIATFADPPGEYEVHVRMVPDGYDNNTNSYFTEEKYSDMVIVVDKD